MILKKNGVHLISVMEPIAEGSQGILVEFGRAVRKGDSWPDGECFEG